MLDNFFAIFCLITGISATILGLRNVTQTHVKRDYQKNLVDKDSVNTILLSIVLIITGLFLLFTGLYILLSVKP